MQSSRYLRLGVNHAVSTSQQSIHLASGLIQVDTRGGRPYKQPINQADTTDASG